MACSFPKSFFMEEKVKNMIKCIYGLGDISTDFTCLQEYLSKSIFSLLETRQIQLIHSAIHSLVDVNKFEFYTGYGAIIAYTDLQLSNVSVTVLGLDNWEIGSNHMDLSASFPKTLKTIQCGTVNDKIQFKKEFKERLEKAIKNKGNDRSNSLC